MIQPLTVQDLGTVLGVWAHPDDEAYLSAGLMALARSAGQRVVVATATEGELGGAPGVSVLRRQELVASLASVYVEEHHWLGFRDGQCAQVDERLGAARVAELLDRVRPDTVITFGPDGMTGHADHIAVSRWVDAAQDMTGGRARLLHATLTDAFHRRWGPLCADLGVWMPGATPPSVPEQSVSLQVRIGGHTAHRKLAALRAHRTQTQALRDALGDDTFLRMWAVESFVEAPARRRVAA